jgi:hypothetical protein
VVSVAQDEARALVLQLQRQYITVPVHYITLHYITLHYITLHYITLHYITLHYIVYTSTAQHSTTVSGDMPKVEQTA